MNAATAIREQARMLAIEIGEKATAEKLGIPYDRVRQWSHRYGWKRISLSVQQPVTVVTRAPADVLTDELQQNEKQTRLSLSRYTARAALDAAGDGSKERPGATLRDAKTVKDLAGTAAITYQWQGKGDKEQSQVAVNIAILGV